MLTVKGLSAGYEKVAILDDIDLSVTQGELVVVLGPNGVGKSTLLKAIAGFLQLSAGNVTLDNVRLNGISPEEIARHGLRLVLEGHRVFPRLSVRDNLRLGCTIAERREEDNLMLTRVLDIFPQLKFKLADPALSLSGGQQQMLALGQGMMGRPRVLLCDEPSLGLAQSLSSTIFDAIRQMVADGLSVVLVEQQVSAALEIADRAYVLEQGRIVLSGTASEVARDTRVRDVYLGL